MKRNDSGDFCVLFVEAMDERASIFETITGQKKPVVLLLSEQARVFQRPDDFQALKRIKRQIDKQIVFVMPGGDLQAQLAVRHGFPVYASMDTLSDALMLGQATRQRVLNRTTVPLQNGTANSRPGVTQHPMPGRTTGNVELFTRDDQPFDQESTGNVRPSPVGGRQLDPTGRQPRRTEPLMVEPDGPLARPEPRTPLPLSRMPTRPAASPQRRRLGILLILLAAALAFAGIGSLLVFSSQPIGLNGLSLNNASALAIAGHVAFISSEQVSENSSQGIMDQVNVDLSNLAQPASGKSYYAWLLSDTKQSDTRAVLLGRLQVNNGRAHLFYPGDGDHTSLLLSYSRFLVTEEDSTMPPVAPTPDQHAWRYYGEFLQTPVSGIGNVQSYSYLDHLRHLLVSDPALDDMELVGGLNNWLFRNTGKVLEWASSMREKWENTRDTGFVRHQTTSILTYLDGLSYIKQDLAPGTPLPSNERLARVGLICVNGPNQDPACYVAHVVNHLSGLLQTTQPTQEMREHVADLVSALNNVTFWMTQLRQDARQILKMNDQKLKQPATLSLINDMINNANHAYSGQNDPSIGEMRQGVVWAHEHMQALATMDIKPFVATNSSLQMVPNIRHARAGASGAEL